MPESALAVEHLFSLTAILGPAIPLHGGPQGARIIVPVTGGSFAGERLAGVVAEAPGGDWVTQRDDGSIRLDVRIVLQTNDGASILMTYSGIGNRGADGLALRTAPQFETGDARYAWLNNVQAVGVGASAQGKVEYEVYRLL